MSLRTVYLQSVPSVNGRNALSGRALYDQFRKISAEALLGLAVWSDDDFANIKNPAFKSDIISHTRFNKFDPNVVFIEGGLFTGADGTWKLPQGLAESFCRSGGVVIVADVDSNELHHKKAHYQKAGSFFRAFSSYGRGRGDDSHPVYGSDRRSFWRGGRQILCDPKKNDPQWLAPPRLR